MDWLGKGSTPPLKRKHSIIWTSIQEVVLVILIVQVRIDEFYYATDANIKYRHFIYFPPPHVKERFPSQTYPPPEIVGQILAAGRRKCRC